MADVYQYEDPLDTFERPPYAVKFHSDQLGRWIDCKMFNVLFEHSFVTIVGEGLPKLRPLPMRSWLLSREGSLSCHIGLQLLLHKTSVYRSHPEGPPHKAFSRFV